MSVKRPTKTKHAKIHKAIDTYLAKRSYSTGGWAPVTREEVDQLYDLMYAIVNAKYGPDPDGDRPINFKIIDRTKFEPMHFFQIPYSPRTQRDAETAEGIATETARFENASANLSIAMENMRVVAHPILKNMKEFVAEAFRMEAEAEEAVEQIRQQSANPVDIIR